MVLTLAQMKNDGSKVRCSCRMDNEVAVVVAVVGSREDSCHRNEACSCMVVVDGQRSMRILDRSQQWGDDCRTLKEVGSSEEVLAGNACAADDAGAVVAVALADVGNLAFALTTDICNEW
jgi:hypothetical protein